MKRLTKVAFVFLGLLWGSNFIYMKWASALISPMQIAFLRVLFGFLPLAIAAWHKGVIERSQFRHLPHFFAMAAVATAFYYVSIVKGTALLPSGIAGVLGGSIAIFTAIFTLLFLRTEFGQHRDAADRTSARHPRNGATGSRRTGSMRRLGRTSIHW